MKRVICCVALLALALSASALAKDAITDETCEIAVPKASAGIFEYSIRDNALQPLIELGYLPYKVDNFGAVSSAKLFLDWGFVSEEKLFGMSTVYRAAVKRRDVDGKDILLGAASSKNEIDNALAKLPACKIVGKAK